MKAGFIVSLFLIGIGAVARAETGTFAQTGSMTSPRFGHTATLLPDGRVLIAGGFISCDIGSVCHKPDHDELYDPATGTFTATVPDLLPDGRVLVAGYTVRPLDPSTSVLLNDRSVLHVGDGGAELFDPVSGSSSPVAH